MSRKLKNTDTDSLYINNRNSDKKIESKTNKINKSNKSNKTNKTKIIYSLNEFVEKFEPKETANQPKKFISKRVNEKKKQSDIYNETKIKRQFNPRIPPYNFVHVKKETKQIINIFNEHEFPSLHP